MTTYNILDVEAAQAGGYDPIPRGTYKVVIDSTEFKTSSNGNPMISVTYEVADGEYEGRKLWDNLVLSEAALPFLRAKLEGIMGEAAFKKWASKGLSETHMQKLGDGGKLVGIELNAAIRIRRNKQTGDHQNVVDSVRIYEEVEEAEEEYA